MKPCCVCGEPMTNVYGPLDAECCLNCWLTHGDQVTDIVFDDELGEYEHEMSLLAKELENA